MSTVLLMFIIITILSSSLALVIVQGLKNLLCLKIARHTELAVGIHIQFIIGYFLYLITHVVPILGNCISFVFFIIALLYAILFMRNFKELFEENVDTLCQMMFIFFFAMLFWLVANVMPLTNLKGVYKDQLPVLFSNMFGLEAGSSWDTMIQYHYIESFKQSPFNRTLCSYLTTVSDRPPVIAGPAFLFNFWKVNHVSISWYTASSLFVCLGWSTVFWAFFRTLGASLRKSLILVSLSGLTPYILFNSFYFWPRAIGAACMLLAFLLFDPVFNQADSTCKCNTLKVE